MADKSVVSLSMSRVRFEPSSTDAVTRYVAGPDSTTTALGVTSEATCVCDVGLYDGSVNASDTALA